MCNPTVGENIRDRLPGLIKMLFECVCMYLSLNLFLLCKVISDFISKLIELTFTEILNAVVEMRTLKSNIKGQIEM